MRLRVLFQAMPARAQGSLGRLEVAVLAQQMSHSLQYPRCHCISGGSGIIGEDFRSMQQRFVIVRGKEEAPVLGVEEVGEQCIEQLLGEAQLLCAETNLL